MTTAVLHQTIDRMPHNVQEMIADYAEFLVTKYNLSALKHPYAGCMKGTFGKMSDDFNEPLDDFKDYM